MPKKKKKKDAPRKDGFSSPTRASDAPVPGGLSAGDPAEPPPRTPKTPKTPKTPSAAVWRRYRRYALALQEHTEAWQQAESQGATVLSSAANIIERLPMVAEALPGGPNGGSLGVLARFPRAPELLLVRHVQHLEKALAYLPDIMAELGACVAGAQAAAADALAAFEADGCSDGAAPSPVKSPFGGTPIRRALLISPPTAAPSPAAAAAAAAAAASLSPAAAKVAEAAAAAATAEARVVEQLQWMEDIALMLALELDRKQQLVVALVVGADGAADGAASGGSDDDEGAAESGAVGSLGGSEGRVGLSPAELLECWRKGSFIDSSYVRDCFERLEASV